MSLFRCSVINKRNSSKFLDLDEVYAVGQVLSKLAWFDHFTRLGTISSSGVTRFGPQGYPKWPLYASEKKDTTYYEYSYWRLKEWETEVGKPTNAYLLKFEFNPINKKPINIADQIDSDKILDRRSYIHAHSWIESLKSVPESIMYPSVRDPNPGGINFAIFNGDTVSNIGIIEIVKMIILDEKSVEIILPNGTKSNIIPKK